MSAEDFDGIAIADHPIPAWWVVLFFALLGFAAGYWIYFHSFGAGRGALARYADLELARMAEGGPVTESDLIAMTKDPMMFEAGKATFARYCVECHSDRGQGKTGPNLTDGYWLYGGMPTDIFQTIYEGKAGKGMPPWGPSLGKGRVKQVTAFVLTLRNQNVPGKEPQGTKMAQ
jgi:cytochrome c oxidase cbb3-type subunit 3